jgi:signal transduction histidine kinase
MKQPETILIIDDETILRECLRSTLESFGYQVVDAASGPEGLMLCAQNPVDLVLLDINMPEMDGFEVCERLKAETRLKDIPVIFLSARPEASEKLRAFHSGGIDYITKPFEPEELSVRIKTHIEIRRQRSELIASHSLVEKALFDAGMMNKKLISLNEKLMHSEQIKSRFISIMRNEINNPLGAILGLAGEITRPTLPVERCRQLAGMIKAEASQLDFQIRNVFCAAELEAGEASPSITQVDIGSILRDAMDSLSSLADSKPVTIRIIGPPDPDPMLFPTDGGRLQLMVVNLLANAIEFSHPQREIEVRSLIQDDSLRISVKDYGIGILEQDKAVIFERFRQLDDGVARQHRGQGLGLAVVRTLVEFLDGWISVESEPGSGSCFTISLPRGELQDSFGDVSYGGDLFFFSDGEEK